MTKPDTSGPVTVLVDFVRAQGKIVAGFWAAMIVLFTIISAFVNSLSSSHSSAWIGARWWPQFFILSMGVQITGQFLRIHVSHGVTRRAFALGGVMYGIGVAIVSGVVMQLGYVVERIIFSANGWQQFHDAVDVVASPTKALGSGVEFVALYAAYFFAGWLISTAFYRHGPIAGLASIIPSLAPALAMELLQWHNPTLLGMLGDAGRALHLASPISTYPLAGAACCVALAAITVGMLRTAGIREK